MYNNMFFLFIPIYYSQIKQYSKTLYIDIIILYNEYSDNKYWNSN